MRFLENIFVTLTLSVASAGAAGGTETQDMSPIPVSIPSFSPFDSQDFCSQIITPTCNTTFSYINVLNEDIRPHLKQLVKTPYFRFFKLDFDKQCKFWNAQHFCATRNCAVEILPPNQYNWSNSAFSPSKLGEIQREDPQHDEAGICEDLDYSHIDDGHNCVYVDLVTNPERFTGYGGNQSLDVWKAIYKENCFPNTNPMSMSGDGAPEQCVEKNLFYRLISGLHASIGVHLSNEYLSPKLVNEAYDSESEIESVDEFVEEQFEPNLKIFMERVGSFNERLSNIYFNYALVSQLIIKLSEIFNGGLTERIIMDEELEKRNENTRQLLGNSEPDYKTILDAIIPELTKHTLFNTSKLFDPAVVSPELKNEFRQRFRNVSSIMDCVGCDRCRMWGKLQTIGYGTALKILFESNEETIDQLKFKRIELVALFNTFDRISKSIEAINNFKQMYLDHIEEVRLGKAQLGEYEKVKADSKGFSFPFLAEPVKASASSPKAASVSSAPSASSQKAAATHAPKKKLIKAPSANNNENTTQTFLDEFKMAFNEVKEATFFVLSSYRTFFPTIWKISIVYLDSWWSQFVGTPVRYESPLEEEYHKLFEQ